MAKFVNFFSLFSFTILLRDRAFRKEVFFSQCFIVKNLQQTENLKRNINTHPPHMDFKIINCQCLNKDDANILFLLTSV